MVAYDEHALGEVARILNAAGVAVIPTDTVYGLAAHPSFPDTVAGVIYQAGAFSCVRDSNWNVEPGATAKKAAADALNGWDPTGGCLYYYNASLTNDAGIIGAAIRVVFPASLIVTLTAGLLPSFATIPMMCLGGTMNRMAMDYNDYIYGNKIIGMSASATSFGSKIAGGLGGSIIGWILAAVHYDPNAAAATTAVRYGIYSFSIYMPLVVLIALFIIVSRFDIEGKYADMMAQIKARNEAEAAAE